MMDGYTYESIAEILCTEGYKTVQGKKWTALNVRQVLFKLRAGGGSRYALAAQRADFIPSQIRTH
jgi:hypothetical protein